jgi:hypothetical protein
MMRKLAALCLLAAISALATQAQTIPSGTTVSVRLGQTISSDKARSGDRWAGTLSHDVVVDGRVVARRGDQVTGRVVDAKASGRLSGTALLALQLTAINGAPVNTSTVSRRGGSHKNRDAGAIGGTAAAGAIIGALAGGGKGAAIGAGAGAAAGTAGAAATGKKDIRIPVETILTFRVR